MQRRPAEWKELQLGVVHHFLGSRLPDKAGSSTNPSGFHGQQDGQAADGEAKKSKKRKNKTDDETAVIDDLFANVTEKKSKKVKA